jgi:uncharacterized DUF497 family protein
MSFAGDAEKARTNLEKHGVSFETAKRVWDDPLHEIYFDRMEDGESRWHAMGCVDGVIVLLVVHTHPGLDEDRIRIVSARRATPRERRRYELEAL